MNVPATTTTTCLCCSGGRPVSPADGGGFAHGSDRRPALTWRPCPSCGWGEHEDAGNSPLEVLSQDVRDVVDVLTSAGVSAVIRSLSSSGQGQVALLARHVVDGQLLVWLKPGR